MHAAFSGPFDRPRIVVADEDPVIVAFVIDTLRKDGHAVFHAYDALSAAHLAFSLDTCHLRIGNSRVDGLPGVELIRQLVTACRTCPSSTRPASGDRHRRWRRSCHPISPRAIHGGRAARSGLGLATAFGIVRQSGGTVRLRSAPGGGTSFSIYLPQVAADVASDAPEREVPRGSRGSGTILVVEEDAQVRNFTCRVLAAHGFQCVEAANGAEAMEIMRDRVDMIDAVVTDVVMPGLDGGALAGRMRELRPSLPVLFTSAYSGEEVVRRGLMPADAPFLEKPFTPDGLVAKLQEVRGLGSPEERSVTGSTGQDPAERPQASG